MQHVEFFHNDHFENRYHRKWLKQGVLAQFIDFFWETDFDALYPHYPDGFSDALFPNVGYTYLINLGTPFVMQLEEEHFEIKSDGFLPRYKYITCHHSAGNKIFGIKFKVSPVVFQKRINFSEYKEYIFPLAYLIDRSVVEKIKEAPSFAKRVEIASAYYKEIIQKHAGSLRYVDTVTSILAHCETQNNFTTPVEILAQQHGISTRTLQRYFEACTSISSKQALQMMRIRNAITHLLQKPHTFSCNTYGYYDYSHFYKHAQDFLKGHQLKIIQPHLAALKSFSEKV